MNEEQSTYEEIPIDPPLRSEEEYQETLKRLENGDKFITELNGWNDPEVEPVVKGFNRLALLALMWEIDHDLIPL